MPPIRALTLPLAAILVALAVTGCGRRGALEPPDAGVKPQKTGAPTATGARSLPQSIGLGGGSAEPDPLAVQAGDELSASAIPPSGTEAPVQTSRGAKRGYKIPKDSFLLDPLL
ncbi:lipoprotein [uncultured Methylobacterium sp.]|uniref:LPS translocon maturation chaperone LptM n=1 Tax=uncultured Methylobacterium sp. TaxID=157278 RepID=UPI0035C9A010